MKTTLFWPRSIEHHHLEQRLCTLAFVNRWFAIKTPDEGIGMVTWTHEGSQANYFNVSLENAAVLTWQIPWEVHFLCQVTQCQLLSPYVNISTMRHSSLWQMHSSLLKSPEGKVCTVTHKKMVNQEPGKPSVNKGCHYSFRQKKIYYWVAKTF